MDRKTGFQKFDKSNASRSASRAGSLLTTLNSRSSRSFMGSKSNFTSSRKNLASDSMRLQRHQARIVNEEGVDVTPQTLLISDHSANRKTQTQTVNVMFKGDSSTPNSSVFSIFGNTLGGNTCSFTQPFSRSVFSNSATDMGTASLSASMTEELKTTSNVKQESADMSRLISGNLNDTPKELVGEDLDKEVEIMLSETDTIWMLDISGTCVAVDSDEAELVKKSNEQYKKVVSSRGDNVLERGVQTINDANKVKQIQTDKIQMMEKGMTVSTWDMYDTYESLNIGNVGKEEETLEELSSRAASRMTSCSTARRPLTSVAGNMSPIPETSTKVPGETTFVVSLIDSGDAENPNTVPRQPSAEVDPTVPNDHPILMGDNLKDTFRIIERAVTQNIYQEKQAVYRDMEPIEDPDCSLSNGNTINSPHLDRLWTYSCPLTKKQKVTCMGWNNHNQDIVAVGYGSLKAEENAIGLICCWSIKNPEFPERIFHAPSWVTSLSFSHNHPNLLAAGLFNGTIVLYNVRNTSHESVLDSRDALHKHSAPIWQMSWVVKEHSLGENKSENLISISVDGHILQWTIRKGFESNQLMNLKRMVSNKQTRRAKKMNVNKNKLVNQPGVIPDGGGEAYISQHAPGMGLDFWPKDPNIYLACTEEGFIHKCSCSYNEQVLETYVGHTGPVYRVSWSPFVTDYFLSCSADWSVKLWNQEDTSPIQSFSSAQKCVNDVCWSPFSSTVFGCVSEGRIEIWNLNLSSLDPMIIHRPLSNATQTCISFAHNSKAVLVGDSEGGVSVYLMKCLLNLPTDQETALLSAISSMSQRDETKMI